MKGANGMYNINGKRFQMLIGSRAQVWHGTAYKTAGGLTKKGLFRTKHGHYVSLKKHKTAKRERRLEKAGYYTRKGEFGAFRKDGKKAKRKTKKRR